MISLNLKQESSSYYVCCKGQKSIIIDNDGMFSVLIVKTYPSNFGEEKLNNSQY